MAFALSTTKTFVQVSCSSNSSSRFSFDPVKLPLFWPWQKVKMGPLSVSPMRFGTWAWGNQLLWGYQTSTDAELQQAFDLAVENGINLFDTADSYGTGETRTHNDIVIATKFAAYPWRLTPGQFVNACRTSLDRLHWSTSNYAPPQELALWDGLVAMYEKGLVRAVGVSNYGPRQLVRIHDYLKTRGVPLCSAQVQFSLLSMGEEQQEIKKLGIRLISYSPLGLGMLTGKYSSSKLPTGPRQILPGLEPLLLALREIRGEARKDYSSGCDKLVHMQRDSSD